jgi:hypothetical protein
MITYQQEKFGDCLSEFKETLMIAHYEELASNKDAIPLDPDYDRYFLLENQGKFHILTVRQDNKLIGYHSAIVDTGLHYKSTLFIYTDIYYIDKPHRGGKTGFIMFLKAQEQLQEVRKNLGFKIADWSMPVKVYQDHSRMFERGLDFVLTEKVLRKILR